MPSSTMKMARFMAGCSHGMKPKGKRKCPPKAVSREFNRHDQRTGLIKQAMSRRGKP